ncbi:involucrin [Dunckerocampus dactyliophorus]|uniref:involucrin n=1 Tax=Dunckerocampus dactyliophorus TaxID=161453 RepID=UPI002404A5C5|nr:involucrin [Dunckerocampus dactyliophorus]XP_054635619.1 involucrin [Dunckerocampus dactyliophorus]
MTAKHRKGKSNHKHEDDNLKSEVPESKVHAGGKSYTLVFFLCLVVVLGGSIGAWFCYQQHQTLSHLTDTFMSMQMKVAQLQSQETMRQTSDKVQMLSDGLESRLSALEESYAEAQKRVGEALATAEQLKTSDLPAQVLSLHTEMKSRLADIQQTTVSMEQLGQLQAVLQGKAEEYEGVRLQMEGLSQQVQTLTGRLEEADAKLEEVVLLKDTLKKQAAQILDLKLQLDSYLTQLETNTAEMVTLRELLPIEHAKQADVEEQINAVRISIQDQNSAAQSLHSELRAQLDNLQRQVTQMVDNDQAIAEPEEQTDPVDGEEGQEEEQASLVDTEPESDEATEQVLTFSELVETEASHTEEEEPSVEEHQSDGEEQLLVNEDDFKPEEEVASEGETGQEEEEEGIVDAEEVESEEEWNERIDA